MVNINKSYILPSKDTKLDYNCFLFIAKHYSKNIDTDLEEQIGLLDEFLPVGEEAADEFIDVVENTNQWTQWRDNISIEMYKKWRTSCIE